MRKRVDLPIRIALFCFALILLTSCGVTTHQNKVKTPEISDPSNNQTISTPSQAEKQVSLAVPREISPLGSFSYRPLEDYELGQELDSISLRNSDGSIVILVQGSNYQVKKNQIPEEIVDEYLDTTNEKTNGSLVVNGDTETRLIDSTHTYFNQISGTASGYEVSGSTFLAVLDEERIVFGMGFAKGDKANSNWQEEGKPAFYALVSSFQFFSPETVARGCQISQDPTYGYTKENPIKVGGGEIDGLPFDGIRREYYYFFILSGPDDEVVEYQRTGSLETEDTLLDEYIVSYEGINEPKTLYIDIYHFEPPSAPVGFSCYSYFPFEEKR